MTRDSAFFSLAGPLDAVPGEGQMRAANFQSFPDLVRNLGGNPRGILERHEVDLRAFRDSDYYIDCIAVSEIFDYCSTYFDDSLFGLHLAKAQKPDVFGPVTALCRAAPTVGQAIRSFITYLPVIHSPVSMFELVEGKDISELRFSANASVERYEAGQVWYQAVSLMLKLFREVGGDAFQPSYVNLTSIGRTRDIPDLEEDFRTPCRTNTEQNAIAFRTSVLNRPIPNSSRHLFQLLDGYLGRIKEASRKTFVERVEDYVRGAVLTGTCSIEQCAKKLGISPRAVRSQLNQSGKKFSQIVEDERMDLARQYLVRPDFSLDEVAFSLGYSEQSSFGRAFKRWTGITPQKYRETSLH